MTTTQTETETPAKTTWHPSSREHLLESILSETRRFGADVFSAVCAAAIESGMSSDNVLLCSARYEWRDDGTSAPAEQ